MARRCPPKLALTVRASILPSNVTFGLAICLLTVCRAQVLAPAGSAPLYVAVVQVKNLAPVSPSTSQLLCPSSSAAAQRALGYPANPSLSKPLLSPAANGLQVPVTPLTPFKEAAPVGPGGPTLYPVHSSSNSHARKLLQQSDSRPVTAGFEGPSSPAPTGTSAIAVGPQHVLQLSGPAITITNISTTSAARLPGSTWTIGLAALMAGAAADCLDVYDPSATYDHLANRFLITATCGGQGRVLLAVSSTSDAGGSWFVFGLIADAVGTALACQHPVKESAMVDYTQVSYNTDGIFITYRSLCPSNATAGGVGLLALPKHAAYRGMVNFMFPVYTSAELQQATAAAGLRADSTCMQLQPVLPQGPKDVPTGTAYFVCEQVGPVVSASLSSSRVTVAALMDTAMLWQYGAPNASSPMLVAQQVLLDSSPAPPSGLLLRQPGNAPALQRGSRPVGFWNGAATLAGGKLYVATSAMVANDLSSPTYSRRPAVAWAELSVTEETLGTDNCAQSKAGRSSADSWNWAQDYSINWGADPDAQNAGHDNVQFEPKLTMAASSGTSRSHTVIKAAFAKPLLLGAGLAAADALYGGEPCSCYACYWGGAYYQYGGYGGGLLAGTGYGYAQTGAYLFAQGRMTRCQSFCTRCWYYGYPGHGFGYKEDIFDDDIRFGFRSVNGQLTSAAPVNISSTQADSAAGTDFVALFTPCNRSAQLTVQVLRQGLISQGGANPLGLVFPTIHVDSRGQLMMTFSYSGPGNTTAGKPAYLGVGAAVVPEGVSDANSGNIWLLRPGKGTVQPALPPGASRAHGLTSATLAAATGWAELSAAALHAASGRIFSMVHYAADPSGLGSTVGTWVSSWPL